MHLTALVLTASASAAFAAQAATESPESEQTSKYCSKGGNAYCASGSLQGNIIIRCKGSDKGPGNCRDNVGSAADDTTKVPLCYETSSQAGDAQCSVDGKIYPDNGGKPYKIPINPKSDLSSFHSDNPQPNPPESSPSPSSSKKEASKAEPSRPPYNPKTDFSSFHDTPETGAQPAEKEAAPIPSSGAADSGYVGKSTDGPGTYEESSQDGPKNEDGSDYGTESKPESKSEPSPTESESESSALYPAGNSTKTEASASASVMAYKPGSSGVTPFEGAAGRLESGLGMGMVGVGAGVLGALAWVL